MSTGIDRGDYEYYQSMAHADSGTIENTDAYRCVARITPESIATFPEPISVWIDAVYDCASQYDAYRHLAPIRGKRVLQLGGMGIHAVKFLRAGVREAHLLSPVPAELEFAQTLAQSFNVLDGLCVTEGVAESLPYDDGMFDRIYSGGCLHHTDVSSGLREIQRVLAPGGRFSAVDPWRAPLHRIGTAIFGKREADVHCKPLSTKRMAPGYESFPDFKIIHHGTLLRYPLLALNKLHLPVGLQWAWRINRADDAICSCLGLRRWGSSVAVLGENLSMLMWTATRLRPPQT